MTAQSKPPIQLHYRPEVDGLRAIAVVSVILYHAKMSLWGKDWFEGGFIGVDIFFVISGYLITRIIMSELQASGSFDYRRFYVRRARRLLPMLFFVILATFPFAWQKLLPQDLVEYAHSIVAATLFASNFFFYLNTTEYGADSALLKPLLHTWTLSVEEQFYLLFPAITIFAFRFFRKNMTLLVALLSFLSLAFAVFMAPIDKSLNFYLPFSRFWELSFGSLIALYEFNRKIWRPNLAVKVLPSLGFALVVFSVFLFDESTPHPAMPTLLPVVGVGLIIAFASRQEVVGQILSYKPITWLGLLSYSAYLWHFPVFAFARMGSAQPSNYDKISWIALTLGLSFLSYVFIEEPCRRRMSNRLVSIVLAFWLAIIAIGVSYAVATNGIATQERLGFNLEISSSIEPTYLFGDDGCRDNASYVYNESEFCILGNTARAEVDYVLLGDSHAMHLQPLLQSLSTEMGLKGLFGGASGCPALLGVYPDRGTPHPNAESRKCFDFNQGAYELTKAMGIKTVFLVSRWDYYVDGSDSGSLNKISDLSLKVQDVEQSRSIYREAVARTLAHYDDLGVRVVVMLQVPHQNTNVKRVVEDLLAAPSLARKQQVLGGAQDLFLPRSEHQERQSIANRSWFAQKNAIEEGSLVLVDPTEHFCNVTVCPILDSNVSFYTDFDHASEAGLQRLENRFRDILEGILYSFPSVKISND